MSVSLVEELVQEAGRLEELAADPYDAEEVAAVMTPAGLARMSRLLRTAADVVGVGLERDVEPA